MVVADGANSRFGRALGTFRTREWPYGTAIRTYWESPRHAEPWIESALDVKDRNGNPMPGYGWIFPVGDGTVNIGVGLLSTFREFKTVNTTSLLDGYAHQVADRWEINPDQPECKATSGRIPMGGSVGPKAGPSYLVIGDAAGSVNPFNGEGIDYAYETAHMAAQVLHEAIDAGDPTVLQRYPSLLDDEYGEYFKVARLFARVIGRPALMRELTRAGMHSRTLMEWVLRIMANLLRPDELGPAEAAYKAAAKLVRLAPNAVSDSDVVWSNTKIRLRQTRRIDRELSRTNGDGSSATTQMDPPSRARAARTSATTSSGWRASCSYVNCITTYPVSCNALQSLRVVRHLLLGAMPAVPEQFDHQRHVIEATVDAHSSIAGACEDLLSLWPR